MGNEKKDDEKISSVMNLTESIKQKAIEVGFDLVGITEAGPVGPEHKKKLTDWLEVGGAADMQYMHRNLEKRVNPAKLLENAKSVICLGLNYTPCEIKTIEESAATGRVANYALYEDYHGFIKKLMRRLVDFITAVAGKGHKFKICVDSVPLAERSIAQRAGLGFIGKNHMLINSELGGQIFLGAIITTLELEADLPIEKNCQACDKCIKACPSGALGSDGYFDAGKCISYLTIEMKKEIPAQLASKIGNRLFGCDECVLACPYQENAPACKNEDIGFYPDIARLDLAMILGLDDAGFEASFGHTSLGRAGLDKLKSMAKICLENQNSK